VLIILYSWAHFIFIKISILCFHKLFHVLTFDQYACCIRLIILKKKSSKGIKKYATYTFLYATKTQTTTIVRNIKNAIGTAIAIANELLVSNGLGGGMY
jgi:hypothetical protein